MLFLGYGALDGVAFTGEAGHARAAEAGLVALSIAATVRTTGAAGWLCVDALIGDLDGVGWADAIVVWRLRVLDADRAGFIGADGA